MHRKRRTLTDGIGKTFVFWEGEGVNTFLLGVGIAVVAVLVGIADMSKQKWVKFAVLGVLLVVLIVGVVSCSKKDSDKNKVWQNGYEAGYAAAIEEMEKGN